MPRLRMGFRFVLVHNLPSPKGRNFGVTGEPHTKGVVWGSIHPPGESVPGLEHYTISG